ncbi:MAG: VOC family protein [Candidatus Izemoplasmatales bacterium]|nr:VOC family protein [Candidatus Izemoplasmatales bacterium]
MIKGIAHLAFRVTNMEESIRFYEKYLGIKKKFELDDDHGNPWIVYLAVSENQFIELFYSSIATDKPINTSYQHLCLEVDDVRQIAKDLVSKGLTLDVEPLLGKDFNWQCWIHDPDGNPIELMQYTEKSLQRQKG